MREYRSHSMPRNLMSLSGETSMPRIALADGVSLHCAQDDYLWPWHGAVPVLMLHGFARNARFWNRWVPPIAETHRIYRPDLLGCGESDPPPAGYPITPEAIAAQILAVLDTLSLERVHWVGESSGGIVGVLLAAKYPERIASLVLCNTPTRIPDEIKRIYALDRESASAAMRAYGVGKWCRQTLGYRLDRERASTELCEWVIGEMDRTPPEIAAEMHDCFESVDTLPLLAGIDVPVLLLCGDRSRIAAEQQRALAELLPRGRLELLPGYGHGVNLLQPERCARASLDFWRAVELRQ
jgi:pimeloyl-ACP methyl ester carboxylesterase